MTGAFPLTRLGAVIAGACLLSYVLAVMLDWREFAALTVGFGLTLLIAVPFVAFGGNLKLDRRIEPIRVEAGRQAQSLLTVTNTGRRKTSPRVVEDRFSETPWHHDIPSLDSGARTITEDPLPTARRGVFEIGPATLVKTDPLGMLRRSLDKTDVSKLWVYPRSVPLATLRSGFAKDLEGPTSDTSPAGDIAFHTIREYADGDDVRHVHWLSTAKTGTLMVRHYVDNRRPYLGVVVDSDPSNIGPDGFERALEVAASHIRSADLDGRPISVVVGDQEVMTSTDPIDPDGALDRLCLSVIDLPGRSKALAERVRRLRVVAPETSAVLIVTGPRNALDLLPVVEEVRGSGRVVVARIVPEGTEPIAVPGSRVMDCQDVDGFAVGWERLVG